MTVTTKMWVHEGDLTVLRTQDCEDIIERNKRLKNEPQRNGDLRHVASIPNVILEKWLNEEFADTGRIVKMFGPEMDEIVAKKLKDPDWAYLRVDK